MGSRIPQRETEEIAGRMTEPWAAWDATRSSPSWGKGAMGVVCDRATILSVASRGGAGLFDHLRFFALGAPRFRSLLPFAHRPPGLGVATASRGLRGVVGSLACDGAFDSCACGGAIPAASILAGSTCGVAGARHHTTVLASPSGLGGCAAMTPVPTISVTRAARRPANLP